MAGTTSFAQYLAQDNLDSSIWVGEVVDNNDPLFSGRCKVRIYGKFDGTAEIDNPDSAFNIPDSDLPWAYPAGSTIFGGGAEKGAGSLSVPKVGTKVKVVFSGGNIYSPEYVAIQDVNTAVIEEVKQSYQNAHVLFYDEDEKAKVVYTPAKGLEIFHKDSHIVINPDSSITIEHKDTSSIIELVGSTINITANSAVNITANSKINSEAAECVYNGTSATKLGPAPAYSAVLAEPLWTFLKMMASAVDAKLPSTPGVLSTQAASFEQLSTSKNVKLSS
jgi:hypothetical protein